MFLQCFIGYLYDRMLSLLRDGAAAARKAHNLEVGGANPPPATYRICKDYTKGFLVNRQELFCHNCNKYVRFDVPENDGRLVVICPDCGHEHLRVVSNGVITEERWGSRNNQPVMYAGRVSSSATSFVQVFTANSTSSSSTFIAQSWLDSTSV